MDSQQMNVTIGKKKGYLNDQLDAIYKNIRTSWALIPNEEYERLVCECECDDQLATTEI